jgi:DNA-binding NarL/FixJ family response regulator
MDEIRVAIIDDHAIVRQGLRAMIDREPDLRVVADRWAGHCDARSDPAQGGAARSQADRGQ